MLHYKIQGMDCAEEVALLRRVLLPIVSDESRLRFDLLQGKLSVEADETLQPDILGAIAGIGLKAVPWARHAQAAAGQSFYARRGRTVVVAFCGAMILAAFSWHVGGTGLVDALAAGEAGDYPPPSALLYLCATSLGLLLFAGRAWGALRALRPDMNLLMCIAVLGALLLGNYYEAALVSFLFSTALLLETWSVGRAHRAITALMDLTPPTARYRCPRGGEILEKPVEEVPLGVTVLLRPGERFPLDGVLVRGHTSVNQAPITGESLPVEKQPGDEVFAGTINQEGAVEFECTRSAGDTLLARCIALVDAARTRRAPVERWIDQFARHYTPIMIVLAILVALVPPLVASISWSSAFYNALVLLLIACPCALVISTPVTIVAGLARAARMGVLIKGGAYLEAPARLRAIAIDKTGTLTTGAPCVHRVVPLNGHSAEELLSRAASIECLSAHPLARAVVRHAEEQGYAFAPATSYTAIQGKGAEAYVGDAQYWIGSHRLFQEKALGDAAIAARAAELEDAGHSVVLLGRGSTEAGDPGHVCGLISIADSLRPESARAVAALKAAGIEHVAMLTGDNEGTARAIAEAAGMDAYSAQLLPKDKADAVLALVARYGHVAMVGDGVNDAPAMAAANVGIAMGAAGSDAAIETADIALMADDLGRLAWLVRHSRRTLRTVRQNIVLALGIKLLVFVLAIGGLATLWLAILADMGASLLVIFNGLRLLRDDGST